ncbi:MAG: carbon-nitrogen family hydrolase [Planctomycetota bacterium]|nr:carbon-nitrogen family hydrolase [Planctomycetota bacterium]
MRFAAIQYDVVWEDKSANHGIVEQMLHEAKIEPGTFVVLPELGDTGFSFNLPAIVDDSTLAWAQDLASRMQLWLQVGYARLNGQGKGLNCASIISPQGDVVGTYEKVHPFSIGRESEHYVGGDKLVVIDCDGTKICPLICYDLRFPELWRHAALAGAEVFTLGASWPNARQEHWRSLLLARAIENQAFVVGVNRIGADPHLNYAGGSIIISPLGLVISEVQQEPAVLKAFCKSQTVREWRQEFPALKDVRGELLGAIRVDS